MHTHKHTNTHTPKPICVRNKLEICILVTTYIGCTCVWSLLFHFSFFLCSICIFVHAHIDTAAVTPMTIAAQTTTTMTSSTTTTTTAAVAVAAVAVTEVSPEADTPTIPVQLPTFDTYGKCTTDSVHKSVVDNKFLHSNIIIQSSDTFAFDHQIKSQTHITLLNLTATQVIVHDKFETNANDIDDSNGNIDQEIVNIQSNRLPPPLHTTNSNINNNNCNLSPKCQLLTATEASIVECENTPTCNRDLEINNSASVCVTNMKEPTMVQHHSNHHSGSNSSNGANSVVRKASPDNNNNNQQHTFNHYNYAQPLIDDYNNDTPTLRNSLIYMYTPHNAAISVATSSPSAQQQNSVSSTHVVTTASTIDEVIADTLKDEHNGNSVSVNGGNSVNSNEDETAHYLSLTSANELPGR